MKCPDGSYRTLTNTVIQGYRIAVDCETQYWTFGVTLGHRYIRLDIGPFGFTVFKSGRNRK